MSAKAAASEKRVSLQIIGGFLGAGKTTTLLQLAQRYLQSGMSVGIITNDQADNLVDTERVRSLGLSAAEVAGGCFCCRFDDFVRRADELIDRVEPDVILSEPVGSCTDLVATVVKPVSRLFTHRFAVSPFVVLVDRVRMREVYGSGSAGGFADKVTYIYRLQ